MPRRSKASLSTSAETEVAALAKPIAVVIRQRPAASQRTSGKEVERPGTGTTMSRSRPSSQGLASASNMVMTITFGAIFSAAAAGWAAATAASANRAAASGEVIGGSARIVSGQRG